MRGSFFAVSLWIAAAAVISIECSPLPPEYNSTLPQRIAPRDGKTSEACMKIAYDLAHEYLASGGIGQVDPDDAFACLKSIPIDKTKALLTVESARRLVQFQSNLAYLKDPSLGRTRSPPVDLVAALDKIAQQDIPELASEYDFELSITDVFNSAHDYHLEWESFLYRGLFQFVLPRQLKLVSVSADGIARPKVYIADELQNGIVSAVTKVNNVDVVQYLQDESDHISYSSRHSRYNSMFLVPNAFAFYQGDFLAPHRYFGRTVSLTFENLSVMPWDVQTAYSPNVGWTHIIEPESASMYDTFVSAGRLSQFQVADTAVPGTSGASTSGTKVAAADQSRRSVIGDSKLNVIRFVKLSNGREVLVVQLGHFHYSDEDWFIDLKAKLDVARAIKTSNLIIDLRGNTGGYEDTVYRILLLLFPAAQQAFGGFRFRANEAINILGQQLSQPGVRLTDLQNKGPYRYMRYYDMATRAPYTSWAALYGPFPRAGDEFSSVHGQNHFSTGSGIPLFAAANIALVSDGRCGSACALFVELLTQDPKIKGIRLITVGGVPADEPMTITGGIKGGPSLSGAHFNSVSKLVIDSGKVPDAEDKLPFAPPIKMVASSVNFKDILRVGDADQVPIEHIYDPSHCRLYYTAAMIWDEVRFYDRIYEAAWGGPPFSGGAGMWGGGIKKSICVPGSYNAPPS